MAVLNRSAIGTCQRANGYIRIMINEVRELIDIDPRLLKRQILDRSVIAAKQRHVQTSDGVASAIIDAPLWKLRYSILAAEAASVNITYLQKIDNMK